MDDGIPKDFGICEACTVPGTQLSAFWQENGFTLVAAMADGRSFAQLATGKHSSIANAASSPALASPGLASTYCNSRHKVPAGNARVAMSFMLFSSAVLR
ncbi:hypothetical protein [Pseudoduganella sp. R-43]|uniref:hypothetical protein n=1 Tax=Pseudoduganella sp. R-43 TaxID=3404063 RepID=UPI003CEA7E98